MKCPKGWTDEFVTDEEREVLKKQREQEEVIDLICSLSNWFYVFILKFFLVVNLGILTTVLLKFV